MCQHCLYSGTQETELVLLFKLEQVISYLKR